MQARGTKLPDCNRIQISIALAPEIFDKVRAMAINEQRSFSAMLSILLQRALNAHKQ